MYEILSGAILAQNNFIIKFRHRLAEILKELNSKAKALLLIVCKIPLLLYAK